MCDYRSVGGHNPECLYSGACVHQSQDPYNSVCESPLATGPNKDQFGFDFRGIHNDYGQEAYSSLRDELILNLRKFGYDPIISDETKFSYRQLYEFEGWYLNCGVQVPTSQFSEEMFDAYWKEH